MTETLAIKLSDPNAAANTDWPIDDVFYWQPVFISPEIDADLTLEGVALKEIAAEVSDIGSQTQVLSYEDILFVFGLEEDVYTTDHHEELLTQMALMPRDEFFLTDSLPQSVAQRRFLGKGDMSAGVRCGVAPMGLPTQEPALGLALGNVAARDAAQVEQDAHKSLLLYAMGKGAQGLEHMLSPEMPLDFMVALAHDADPDRVRDITQALSGVGCADLRRDEDCVRKGVKIAPTEYEELMREPQCRHFEEDIACVNQILPQMMIEKGQQVYQQGLGDFRARNKGNTYTSGGRALMLHSAIGAAALADRASFADPVQKILIIGPGLEEVHPEFNVSVPRQSYEPFAVWNAAVEFGKADPQELRLDLVDINPRVVSYFTKMIDAAGNGAAHKMYLLETPTEISFETVSQFSVAQGDVITDHLAPDESYDWIVMMNTFMYFSDAEKLLALENIARMLKRGGVLFTDLDPEFLPTHMPQDCPVSAATALQTSKNPGYPVVMYRKP